MFCENFLNNFLTLMNKKLDAEKCSLTAFSVYAKGA